MQNKEVSGNRSKSVGKVYNCKVGKTYPMAPGMVPAQSKAIFDTDYDVVIPVFLPKRLPVATGISHPLQKMFELANRDVPVLKMVNPCSKGGICIPGGGHGSIEWCEKCNQVI